MTHPEITHSMSPSETSNPLEVLVVENIKPLGILIVVRLCLEIVKNTVNFDIVYPSFEGENSDVKAISPAFQVHKSCSVLNNSRCHLSNTSNSCNPASEVTKMNDYPELMTTEGVRSHRHLLVMKKYLEL